MTCGHFGVEPRGLLLDGQRKRGNMHTLAHRYLYEGGRNRHQPKRKKSVKIKALTCTDDEEVKGECSLALEGDRTHLRGRRETKGKSLGYRNEGLGDINNYIPSDRSLASIR